MANQPRANNPARTIRVDDELWRAVQERAAEKNETVSAAIRKFLIWYARRVPVDLYLPTVAPGDECWNCGRKNPGTWCSKCGWQQ